jgi:dynactin 1
VRSENELLESQRQDAFDQAEMATLDREVAEEKAEAAEAEAERLNEKIQELELEVAVLKEENAEYEKPIDGLESGGHTSIAYIQLEKHNERLKDAVIQLRDMLHDAEKEYKLKIQDLEKELSSNSDLSGRFELTTAKLAHSEAQVEDLKQQLDDALGAEDLLEELTERNLQMSDKMEEMRATIDDLEALKELNDELEENHVETEKQLEAEIDRVMTQMKEEGARSAELEALVVDMETTIGQFRELVSNLQAEIDELREQQASQVFDSAAASKESQALLNLNLKLQSSAVKTQSKTVDLELKKLEAAQLAEHLRIVQAYLPEAYLETEADSVSALLFFLRVGEKVNMLTNVISNLHGLPGALHTVSSEALVGVCELRGKLRTFATLNRRFAAVMRRTQPDDYVALGRVVGELAGVESRVDGWIASVKTDEFNDGECARELDALLAQFNHLAEVMFNHPLDAGEQQVAAAYTLEDDLDNFAAAVGFVRTEIMALVKDGDVDVELGEYTLDEAVYDPVQRVLNQVRAVKAPAGKLVAVIEEVAASQAALAPEFSDGLRDLVGSVSAAVDMAVRLAQRVRQHVESLRSSKGPLRLTDIDKFLGEVTKTDGEPWDVIASFVQRLGADLSDVLPKFRAAPKSGQTVSLAAPAPWLARVAAIKEAASYNAEAERRVSRLSDELRDMVREIKLRDQSLQEGSVKIETLERRIEGARKQADHILELEREIAKARKAEKEYEDAIEQLQADQADLEAENAKLRRRPASQGTAPAPEPTTGEQVAGLRAALRHLRSENALLKSRDLYADVHMLPPLRTAPIPELVQDESDAESDGPATPLSSPRIPRLPTRIALETESKLLLRAVAAYASSPRIVDISGFDGRTWHSRKNSPEAQAWRLARERGRLEGRVRDLAERVRALKQ